MLSAETIDSCGIYRSQEIKKKYSWNDLFRESDFEYVSGRWSLGS